MAEDNKKVPVTRRAVTRRHLIRTVGAIGAAASIGPFVITRPAQGTRSRLKNGITTRAGCTRFRET